MQDSQKKIRDPTSVVPKKKNRDPTSRAIFNFGPNSDAVTKSCTKTSRRTPNSTTRLNILKQNLYFQIKGKFIFYL